MGSDLVFDARPDFVAVNEGERESAAPRPGAEEQSALVPRGESGALWIGEIAQVMLEVVLVDGPEMALDFIRADDLSEPAHPGHPKTEDAVGEAPAPVLVLGTFPVEETDDIVISGPV